MAEDFAAAVEDGLRLAKRVYVGKDRAVAPPKPLTAMERAAGSSYLPSAPMFYAVISDPEIVDNPDMPSYQPYVHGKCDPPALIPLQMNGVSLEVDCYLDTAFVTVSGTWRVHCIMSSRYCDCRIAVPMGEQGSFLGLEVEVPKKSYSTQLIVMDSEKGVEKQVKIEDGGFLKGDIVTLTIPQIYGATNIAAKLRWSQKLAYHDGEFTLNIPFDFPEYVTPVVKNLSRREKIQLNVNAGHGTEILCKTISHPLKERFRKAGKLGFSYESEVLSWSSNNVTFTYSVSSSHATGGVLLCPPLLDDVDRRDMFCCYIFPGKLQHSKVFRREVVFVVDISGSMNGKLLEVTKNALSAALSKLNPEDMFNVIAFNNETFLFSTTMEPATAEVVKSVTQWINVNFIADGGTNILLPLNRAVQMLSDTCNSLPIIFLITDGTVEDEKHIYDVMIKQLSTLKNICPRIYTLGIGTFCNHYFLQMLATISHGQHDAATDVESIGIRIEKLFARASSVILANVAFQNLDELDDLEVFPSQIPDLSSESPLIVSGRYCGTFPRTVKVCCMPADMSKFTIELNIEEAEEAPIGKIVAKHHIKQLTAQAWYSENPELKEKIAKMSVKYDIVSEYTNMALVGTPARETHTPDSATSKKVPSKGTQLKINDPNPPKIIALHKMGLGFGNLAATTENLTPGSGDRKAPDATDVFVKAASNCCGSLCNNCCGLRCIQACSRMPGECGILLTQVCAAMACLGCYACCCAGQD